MGTRRILYGIDLGTTNSAIAGIINGKPTIIKSDLQMDTIPSCVHINPRKHIEVGMAAYKQLEKDRINIVRKPDWEVNTFIEFKRMMGSNVKEYSSNLGIDLSAEDLSAEVLKKLKSMANDPYINAVVITVPAKFNPNQTQATVRSAKLAGFEYCELLQEPVAASLAYGIDTRVKEGYWVVFDFGGGTFDAALMKVNEGIMTVLDTEGDNYLGGKNLDMAIIDDIIIPDVQRNFLIDHVMEDDKKRDKFRYALKAEVERAKIFLSSRDSADLLTDLGDDYGLDDTGTPITLDLSITRSDYNRIASPFFQKAIKITKGLISRNNLKPSEIASVIMVGGPTLTPILKELMNKEFPGKADFSTDPMTVVATGAALFASTKDVPIELTIESTNANQINLELKYESSTIETTEYLSIKLLEGVLTDPETSFYCVIERNDGAWGTSKIPLSTTGDVLELELIENTANLFTIKVYNDLGDLLGSDPSEFSILQGFKLGQPGAILPYSFSLELHDSVFNRDELEAIQKLERNKVTPAKGVKKGLKTPRIIRPGNQDDYIEIPIYAGEYFGEGSKAVFNTHIVTVKITGDDVPSLIPEDSDVDLTITVTRDVKFEISVYFPVIDYALDLNLEIPTHNVPEVEILESYIDEAREVATSLPAGTHDLKKMEFLKAIDVIEKELNQGRADNDRLMQTLIEIRNIQLELDNLEKITEIPQLESQVKNQYFKLEKRIKSISENDQTDLYNMDYIEARKEDLHLQVDSVLSINDYSYDRMKRLKLLLKEIDGLIYTIDDVVYRVQISMNSLNHYKRDFDEIDWKDRNKAKELLDRGFSLASNNPDPDELRENVWAIMRLLPDKEQHKLVKG